MSKSHQVDKRAEGRTDWARIDALTDAEIERMALDDDENPATAGEDWNDAVAGLPPTSTRSSTAMSWIGSGPGDAATGPA